MPRRFVIAARCCRHAVYAARVLICACFALAAYMFSDTLVIAVIINRLNTPKDYVISSILFSLLFASACLRTARYARSLLTLNMRAFYAPFDA